jgi:SAM-dependent methyltransferase
MTWLDFPPGSFDAVLSVLGLFFADDMAEAVETFWRLLRPGGRLAITVLGHAFFDPMRDVFVDAVAAVRPGLDVVQPWQRTEDPETLRQVFARAGVSELTIESESRRMPLRSPHDWWRIVLGTGLRRTIVQLDTEAATKVREQCLRFIQDNQVSELVLDAHYTMAEKP